jgi:hypothetical protein
VDENDTYLRIYRWDGSTWSQLDALTLELDTRTPRSLCLFGSKGFLLGLTGVSAPDQDPVYFWQGLGSTGEAWPLVSGYNEYEVDDVHAVQMGTPESPTAMLLIHVDDQSHYEIPDEDDLTQFATQGTFDMRFVGSVAGVDLDHMVGVVSTDGPARFVMRNAGRWRQLGAGQIQAGVSSSSLAWYGSDAVGVASQGGVTVCAR